MRLLSKEAFTSDKLAQIILFYFLSDITILIDYGMKRKLYEQPLIFRTYTLDKSLLGQMPLGQMCPLTTVPWTNVATPSNLDFK